MTALPRTSIAALEPVRAALRTAARHEVAQIRDAARAEAAATLEHGRREAEQIRTEAVAEGTAVARGSAALLSARARREAHEVVLAQQQQVHASLVDAVTAAVSALRDDRRYPRLVDRLTELCGEILGPDVVVTESPTGGVVAERGERRLDLSLPALAAAALDAMAPEVSALWAS